jgi:hypothetical protein
LDWLKLRYAQRTRRVEDDETMFELFPIRSGHRFNPEITGEEILDVLSSNLCRGTGLPEHHQGGARHRGGGSRRRTPILREE